MADALGYATMSACIRAVVFAKAREIGVLEAAPVKAKQAARAGAKRRKAPASS
jgi:hypothetical protein